MRAIPRYNMCYLVNLDVLSVCVWMRAIPKYNMCYQQTVSCRLFWNLFFCFSFLCDARPCERAIVYVAEVFLTKCQEPTLTRQFYSIITWHESVLLIFSCSIATSYFFRAFVWREYSTKLQILMFYALKWLRYIQVYIHIRWTELSTEPFFPYPNEITWIDHTTEDKPNKKNLCYLFFGELNLCCHEFIHCALCCWSTDKRGCLEKMILPR